MKAKRVVVAGATGYLGKSMVVALHEAGHAVRALVRDPTKLGDTRKLCESVVVADATVPQSLKGLCDDADTLFSSVGTRSLRRQPSHWDVDYRANMNLIAEARRARVGHVVFVSAFNGRELRGRVSQMDARERVVDDLRWHGPTWTIVRPTGFFNDMAELYDMAKAGTAWICGSGKTRINPVDGADLARAIVQSLDDPLCRDADLEVGGPEVLTLDEAALVAFRAAGRPPRVRHIPAGLVAAAGRVAGAFNSNLGSLVHLLAAMGDTDFVAPCRGNRRLSDFYGELVASPRAAELRWAR